MKNSKSLRYWTGLGEGEIQTVCLIANNPQMKIKRSAAATLTFFVKEATSVASKAQNAYFTAREMILRVNSWLFVSGSTLEDTLLSTQS